LLQEDVLSPSLAVVSGEISLARQKLADDRGRGEEHERSVVENVSEHTDEDGPRAPSEEPPGLARV